jgi:hypothetical protein
MLQIYYNLMYYHLIFQKKFPNYKFTIPYWMPKWSDSKDPSGRMMKTYDEVIPE